MNPLLHIFLIAFLAVAVRLSADDKNTTPKTDGQNLRDLRLDLGLVSKFKTLLENKEVRKEIEISDAQFDEAKLAIDRYSADRSNLSFHFAKATEKAGANAVPGVMEQILAEHEKAEEANRARVVVDLNEILLPHQVSRLRQLARQGIAARQVGGGIGLEMPLGLANDLGLSSDEKAKLVDAYKELRPEFDAELEKLRDKYLEEILQALPEGKRENYKELVGENYDFQRSVRERFLQSLSGSKGNPRVDKDE